MRFSLGHRPAPWQILVHSAFCLMLLMVSGCVTKAPQTAEQFTPIPPVSVAEQTLAPVSARPATELLREADAAYRQAKAAQESGDQAAATAQFNKMIELLVAADLDPKIFYSLRTETEGLPGIEGQPVSPNAVAAALAQGLQAGQGYSPIEMPFPLPPQVIAEIEEIQQVYPKNFQSGLDRSQKYLPYVREEFAKAGLPSELAWLAMVESLYQPKVVSRAGAGGMWQFMRSTGQRYHLRIESYIDERYNWKSATKAAIQYLEDLHNFFGGSWPLAVTAYNMGEGGMLRAVEANGGERDYWKLLETPPASNRMATETKKYYPRFLAYILVGNSPERYGFRTNPQTPETTVRVSVPGMYSLNRLDEAMGYAPGTLAGLNPDLVREVTPPSSDYGLSIPAEGQEQFAAALQKTVPGQEIRAASTHKVRRGESLTDIADQYGMSERELMRANRIRTSQNLKPGQVLKIPEGVMGRGGPEEAAASPAPAPSSAPSTVGEGEEYVVKRGETLFNIAKAHHLDVQDLARWNNLSRRTRLKSGDRLRLSGPAAAVAAAPAEPAEQAAAASPAVEERFHTIRRGETPEKIARRYHIALADLLKWNGLSKKSTIHEGDKLRVTPKGRAGSDEPDSRKKTAAAESGPSESTTHTVAKGETAAVIANKYDVSLKDLLGWNDLTHKSVLRVGQKLSIQKKQKGDGDESEETATADKKDEVIPDEESVPSTISHTVAKGETAGTIATKYGVSLKDVMAWNHLTAKSVLRVGQTLTIREPKKNVSVSGAETAAKKKGTLEISSEKGEFYTVAQGDTAGSIADKKGLKLKDLLVWNNLTDKSMLKVGQKLALRGPGDPGEPEETSSKAKDASGARKAPSSSGKTYTVAAGDTAGSIADKNGVALKDLLSWNNLTGKSVLKVGQKLTIRGTAGSGASEQESSESDEAVSAKDAPAAPKAEKSRGGDAYTVAAGDTAGSIADKNGIALKDLLAWNNLTGKSVLKVGQQLIVRSPGKEPAEPAKERGADKKERGASTSEGSSSEDIVHVVAKGQNASTIAKKYGVKISELQAWNHWDSAHVLQIGDKVVIRKKP